MHFEPDSHRYGVKQLILLRSKLGHLLTLALNRNETMKIMLLVAATLSLGVGAANADNKGNANTNEGNANTRHTQTIREAAPTSHPEVPPPPVVPVVPPLKGWQQDRQLILLY
jgi:hypothetical protein